MNRSESISSYRKFNLFWQSFQQSKTPKWNKQTRLLWSFRNSLTVKRNLDWRANQQFHSPLIALRVYRITQGSMMRPWRRKWKLFFAFRQGFEHNGEVLARRFTGLGTL